MTSVDPIRVPVVPCPRAHDLKRREGGSLRELLVKSADETIALGRRIGGLLTRGSIVALEGPLGAGKTTLVKGIAEGLGITEPITSPTFTIVSEYDGVLPLFHVDLYRVGTPEEIELLGLDELIYGEGVSVVEWSDKAPELFIDPLTISLEIVGPNDRIVRISGPLESFTS